MYEYYLTGKEAEKFKNAVRQKMDKDKITYKELSKTTGYTESTLKKFMKRNKWSRFVAASILDYLNTEGDKAWNEFH